ncbi:hypothetical protein MMC08_002324 [Hypocenomyce scalaris]|nr:hypothetical protein [Hypocenomyce scalaris]
MGNMTAVIDFDVTSYLTDLESETSAVPFLSASTPSLLSKLFDARLMTAFFDQIHQWYPIFDRQSFEAEYLLASTRPVQPSSNSCLFLMVSAIGALALNLENGGAGGNNINEYAAPALQMLHIIMSDHTLIGAQCLIICAIYHLLCFKPIQACQYLTSASYKMQNLYRRNQGRHVVDTELYRRAFYALYIMERQLLVHIDLAGFGISAWQENISLPSGTFENGNTDGETIEFYLAEIAMNKMMERSDQNLSTNLIHQPGELRLPNNSLNRNEFLFANIVAKEIGSQIAEWRRHLPLNIAFPDVGICGSQLSSYLKTQYNALMCGIYWHALYKATIMEDRSPDVVSACQKCLVSFCSFIDSVADLFSKPVLLPQISTTLASVFTISLAVIVVRNEQILKDMGQLEESCARAVEELRRYAVIYPAVGRWADVLASRLDSDK